MRRVKTIIEYPATSTLFSNTYAEQHGATKNWAIFSADQQYRYLLTRLVGVKGKSRGVFGVMGLNPSTADAFQDDPTIRRCMGFAERAGFRQLIMLNMFALRATDPSRLLRVEDPVGPWNTEHVRKYSSLCDMFVCAWGTNVARIPEEKWKSVRNAIEPLKMCFGVTKDGYPKHPLYLPNACKPEVYFEVGLEKKRTRKSRNSA